MASTSKSPPPDDGAGMAPDDNDNFGELQSEVRLIKIRTMNFFLPTKQQTRLEKRFNFQNVMLTRQRRCHEQQDKR